MSLAASPFALTPMRITRVVHELEDTISYHFDTSARGGFAFAPGQFNMVYLFGAGEVPISISGDAEAPETLVHTIRAVGAVTRPLCALKRGAVLGLRGPYGTAWPLGQARGKDVVFVAGGLGLAPMRPAIVHVLAHRAAFGRVTVLYGARTPKDILFPKELEQWRGRFDCEVDVTVDHAPVSWHAHVGVVPALVGRASFDPQNVVAMVCGPEVMMRFAARELEDAGVPASSIWLSMERSMRCGVGTCGHCQFGPTFVCKDGPVMRLDKIERLLYVHEV